MENHNITEDDIKYIYELDGNSNYDNITEKEKNDIIKFTINQKKKKQIEKKKYREKYKDKLAEKSKEYYQNNKEKIVEKKKEYRENNKDKLKEYEKKYRENNKEKITNYPSKQYITCNCGSKIRKNQLLRHQKTKKHCEFSQ